ncbi:MAG: HEAT repeat domain-containing protein [Gemmatimonadota bacterium]|nr:MAG: HEAT repeat domain-containing protein [Gemmatimonadota bacterium]
MIRDIKLNLPIAGFFVLTIMLAIAVDSVLWRGRVEAGMQEDNQQKTPTAQNSEQLSEETVVEIKRRLEQKDLEIPEKRREFRDFFKNLEGRAFPVLEDSLNSTNIAIRRNVTLALGYMTRPRELRDDEYMQTEKILAKLLIVALEDTSAEIRRSALGPLRAIAYCGLPSPEPSVVEALKSMLTDPESSIRELAASYLMSLGMKEAVPEELIEKVKGEHID